MNFCVWFGFLLTLYTTIFPKFLTFSMFSTFSMFFFAVYFFNICDYFQNVSTFSWKEGIILPISAIVFLLTKSVAESNECIAANNKTIYQTIFIPPPHHKQKRAPFFNDFPLSFINFRPIAAVQKASSWRHIRSWWQRTRMHQMHLKQSMDITKVWIYHFCTTFWQRCVSNELWLFIQILFLVLQYLKKKIRMENYWNVTIVNK